MAITVRTVDLGRTGWVGTVTAPSGYIYGVPNQAGKILKIDPATETFSMFGSFSTDYAWAGGILAPNGHIYCVPHGAGASGVLKIDPSTDTTSIVGLYGGSSGGEWWGGALVGTDIFCAPYAATSILVIHTATDTTSLISGIPSGGGAKWSGAALGPNGIIYCAPSNHSQILRIDPSAGTWSLMGSFAPGMGKYRWINAIRSDNGLIYCGPVARSEMLCIDPATDTTSLISTPSHTTGTGWTASILGNDGLLYLVPVLSGMVQRFNPTTASFSMIASAIPGNYQFSAQGGSKLFATPHEGNHLLIIDGVTFPPLDVWSVGMIQ